MESELGAGWRQRGGEPQALQPLSNNDAAGATQPYTCPHVPALLVELASSSSLPASWCAQPSVQAL